MDYDELEEEQNEIDEEVSDIANDNGLNYEFEPMPDGICDISAYLNARVKVMWVLKEPYIKDNYWCSLRELFSEYPYITNISNRTHQYMAYVSYGILNNVYSQDMDYLCNDKSIGESLHEIAYINLSKMPINGDNGTDTDDSSLWDKYQTWKNVLWRQINSFEPDVIIFGGTFRYFEEDFFPDGTPDSYDYSDRTHTYWYGDQLLIDTDHPAYIKGEWKRCNDIISAVNENF